MDRTIDGINAGDVGRRAGNRRLSARRSAWGLAAMLGIALIAAGCGGSSGTSGSASPTSSPSASPTTSATPTKAHYDVQANAICKTFNAKLKSVAATLPAGGSAAQFEAVLTDAISVAQAGTTKLERLPQPAGESTALSAAYKGQEAQVTDIKNILAAVKANSATKARSAIAVATASSAPLNKQFDALGLTICGSGTTAPASA